MEGVGGSAASVESHPSAKDALGWGTRGLCPIRAGPTALVYNPWFPIFLTTGETIR